MVVVVACDEEEPDITLSLLLGDTTMMVMQSLKSAVCFSSGKKKGLEMLVVAHMFVVVDDDFDGNMI